MANKASIIFFVCLSLTVSALISWGLLRLSPVQKLDIFPDDSFYYLVPAMNISRGLGPTSDGITKTSGFHPLWIGTLTAAFFLTPEMSREGRIAFVICSGALLHAATAILVFLALLRLTTPGAATLWAAAFLFSSGCLKEAIGGTEAPLLAFMLALFAYLSTMRASMALDMIKGAVLGLLFLARTDSFFFVAAWYLIRFIQRTRETSSPVTALREAALPALCTSFVVIPWFLISHAVFGSMVQNSMQMKQLWRARLLEGLAPLVQVRFSLGMLLSWFKKIAFISPLLLIGIVAMASRFLVKKEPKARDERVSVSMDGLYVFLAALAVYVVSAGLFYAFNFSFIRSWYFMPARLLIPLLGAALFVNIGTSLHAAKLRFMVAFLVLSGIALGSFSFARDMVRAGDKPDIGPGNFLLMAGWLNRNVPPDAVVGAYSSGILAYYCDRKVVNLDGLSNNEMLDVAKSKTIEKFLDRRGITYLADHESIVKPGNCGLMPDAGPEFIRKRLREIHRIHYNSIYGDLIAYRILPSGQALHDK